MDSLALSLHEDHQEVHRACEYQKKKIPVERMCNMLRFNLGKVRRALQRKGIFPSSRYGETRLAATVSGPHRKGLR